MTQLKREPYFPEISIIMAVYNAEKYLRESIESLLNQIFRNFELIIVNDGSTDESLKIIESYNDERIVLIDQENEGVAISRNNAIKKSRTNYIAILDSDDIALPERLKKQYQFLSNNQDYIIIGSNAHIIDMNGDSIYSTELKETNEEIKKQLPVMPFVHPSVMFKKDIFYKAGKYPDKMIIGEDAILLNRMVKFGKVCNLNECLIKYRIVPTALSSRNPQKNKEFEVVYNKAVQNQTITEKEYELLNSIIKNRNFDERLSNYHFFLAKKYLWNNYQPKLARKNLKKSIKDRFDITKLILYLMSFFPSTLISKIHNRMR